MTGENAGYVIQEALLLDIFPAVGYEKGGFSLLIFGSFKYVEECSYIESL